MNRKFYWLILLLILLAACGGETAVTPTPFSTAPPVPPTPQPTATSLPEFSPEPEPPTLDAILNQPETTLFEYGWNDREPFRAGLVASAQPILNQLPGAPVYHLVFAVDDSLTTLTGQMEMRYTNQENQPLDKVYFHLFPNLLGGEIVVENVRLNGETAVTATQFDQTILEIALPEPLLPAAPIVISMDFITQVPTETGRNYGIFATVDEIMALSHFYPMVAVFDDEGWHTAPAPEDGDVVYADASFFLVRATLPANVTAATSGNQLEQDFVDGQQKVVYAAGPVRDFYMAGSPKYETVSQQAGEVTINSLAPPEYGAGATAVLDIVAAALEIYGRHYAPYPFTELDVVSTPTLALGVEYPGIFANTLNIYDLDGDIRGTPKIIYLESTTAHEAAHQWFYSLIGNDQLNEPWLDESLAQYATWTYYLDRYGSDAADSFYQSLEGRWDRVDRAEIPIGQPVSAFPGAEYSAIVYGRGPIFVRELANVMGQEAFDAFIRDYFVTFQWQIADTDGFKSLAETHCSCDLTDLF
ncbi:MAG: M1 family metallopeptidase, partial [Anaerolineae bacterium]